MNVRKNVGELDRALRFTAGIILLGLVPVAVVVPGWQWGYLGLVGIVPLVTAFTGYCLPYALLGVNTCGRGCD